MKKVIVSFLVLICSVIYAADDDRGFYKSGPTYEIISNEYNGAIPDGHFAVIGHVYLAGSTTPVLNAEITSYVDNQLSLSSTKSDSSGAFKLIFKLSDTAVYCYRSDLNEVVLTGPFKNRHVLKVNFYLNEQIEVVFKPVIYAYNAASAVSISLKPLGEFTFTYPKSDGTWNIKTNDDGSLTDLSTGKNYPYIFWEGITEKLKFKTSENRLEGFLIKTDTCIQFLENTLTKFGLNEKESTDFITFWGPKIIQKDFALIQFLTTEEYAESIAELSISPQPDALLRLYLCFMPLDSPEINYQIVNPEIQQFTRTGFTIVEWGGSVLSSNQIFN